MRPVVNASPARSLTGGLSSTEEKIYSSQPVELNLQIQLRWLKLLPPAGSPFKLG